MKRLSTSSGMNGMHTIITFLIGSENVMGPCFKGGLRSATQERSV